MKTINRVIVHSTGTDTKCKVKECAFMEGKPKFHYVITRDGEVKQLCFEPWPIGDTDQTVHLAYIGGRDKENRSADNRTGFQKEAMFYKLVDLCSRYSGLELQSAEGETSPGFEVKEWIKNYEPTLALDKEEMALAA